MNEVTILNAITPDFQVNENAGTNGASQSNPSIAADGSGNYIMTWGDERNGDGDIYAQRYSSDWTAMGGNFKVSDDTSSASQSSPSVAADGNGNFIIAWDDGRNGDGDIYAQRYSSDGTAMGVNFNVNDDTSSASQSSPSVAADGNGNFIITWRDYRNGDSDIYAQRYSSDGTPVGSNFKVSDDTSSVSLANPSIAADGSGNFIITWQDERNGAPDIYAQRYSSDGTTVGGNFRVTNTSQKIQENPDVKLWNNRIYSTWTDNRVGGTGFDIWANILEWDNPVGIETDRIPSTYLLHQNYPNPFNPSTIISYSISKSDFVTLTIYDILGREIQTLVSEFQIANIYSVNFDASKLSSGIYFYRLQVGHEFVGTKKMLLMR